MDTLNSTLNVLTKGLIAVIVETEAYLNDDEFMETMDDSPLEEQLHSYLKMEKFCYFIKRKNLFYRTDEECRDLFSDAFINAFFRNKSYPVRSFKGFSMDKGDVRPVKMSKFLKDSLYSKIKTINKEIHNRKIQEVHEHRMSNGDGEEFGFEEFLSSNGIESLDITLEESPDLDEYDSLLLELSNKIYPQVSFTMLLQDYEISQEEFQQALKASLNLADTPTYMEKRYEAIIESISKVILNNKELLGAMFGSSRLNHIGAQL